MNREDSFPHWEAGGTVADFAKLHNMPRSTANSWREYWDRMKTAYTQKGGNHADVRDIPPFGGESVKDMELAALRAKLKIAESTRPPVIPKYAIPASSEPEAKWKSAEAENAELIKKCLLTARFSVELPSEPCALTFISDQHISLGNCVDLERMRHDAETVAATEGCYAILGGDATDNHIKHRAAVLAARSQPGDQFELFEWYLSIFAHRILVAIAGNHDLWTNQLAGVDVLSMLLKRQGVCYAPDEARLSVKVGSQEYRVAMRHQYRMNSTFNETHAVKQFWRHGDGDWDIGCIGHNHVGACEYFYGHGQERVALRPGSYQITSAYSRQFGFNSTRPTCPTVVVYPDRREMVAFQDLKPALRFLRGERGGK